MLFTSSFLIVDDKTVVALQFVESISFPTGEDETVEKLMNDAILEIVMSSGREYKVSTKAQYASDDWRIIDEGIHAGRAAIFDKWKHVLTGKSQ